MAANAYLIGITGPSGAGKSFLARNLAEEVGALVLGTDAYYRDLAHLPLDQRACCNFDDPIALDHEILIEHIARIGMGEAVEIPLYDFATHTRTAETKPFGPAEVVIVEGLFTLHWEELRTLFGTKVYVDMTDDICLDRRTQRDVRERGRTAESVHQQYATTVAPMAERYVRPTLHYADVVVFGNSPIKEAVARVVEHYRQRAQERASVGS